MTFRFIAADLDGTLRPEGKTFTPRVRQAVRDAEAHGVRVVMATGRMFRTAVAFARELGLHDAIICDQGATIRDLRTNDLLFEMRMPLDLAREVVASASPEMTLLVCLDEEFYVARLTQEAKDFVGRHQEHLHCVSRLLDVLTRAPQKLVFVNDAAVSTALLRDYSARFGKHLQVVQSYPLYVELTHPGVSKGTAVAWLARRWGILQRQVIAIGDQDNDRSMIEWAGLGVAMGNAIEGVKQIADFVAPSADDDGVAQVIERFVLNGNESGFGAAVGERRT